MHDEAAFLTLVKARWDQAERADRAQRQRELDDLRFFAGDQWPKAVQEARAGQEASLGLPASPPRPCFVINKVREPVRQVVNQERNEDMGLELVEADDTGEHGPVDPAEVETREGLIRRIQRSSEAADARTWAFTRSTIAGRGYYGVMTRFVPGKTWDQEIYIERFLNQASVTLDPAHEQPDGSDATWAFVGTQMPFEEYRAQFPRVRGEPNRVAMASTQEFRALGDEAPTWFDTDGEVRMCRVVNHWYTEFSTRTLVRLSDGSTWWTEELPDPLPAGLVEVDRRSVQERAIKWAKLDGVQVLEETDWPGPDLPIVKVVGEELQPYDQDRRCEGMVRSARDACQGFNAMVSQLVHVIALSPVPPLQVATGQIDGYEAWYEAATTRSLPYLPYHTKDASGTMVAAPQRPPTQLPIEPIAAAMGLFDLAIKSTTGVPDPSLGKQDPSVKSGRMAMALIRQADRGTSHYLDNLHRSLRYEGQIVNNLLYPIYGRPGRLLRVMTNDGETHSAVVGTETPGVSSAGGGSRLARLTDRGRFSVQVKVTRAFDSRRTEEASMIADLLAANPQLMAWFGDLFFKNQDGPGHEEMADRAKVMLDPKLQAYLAQQAQGQEVPPALMAQLAQLQARLQAAEGVIQHAQQELTGKQQELASKERLVAIEWASKERIAAADRETKLAVAELGAKVDRLALFVEERGRLGLQAQQAAHEADEAARDRTHELVLATSPPPLNPSGEATQQETPA